MAEIRLTGNLSDLHRALTQAAHDAPGRAAQVVQEAGTRYQVRAKFFVPVDTGELRGSITVHPDGPLAVTVTAHAAHGIFQEHGTSRMAPQPFMAPAEEITTPEVVDEFRDLGRGIF